MTMLDVSLCSSDCGNSFCQRHKSRKLIYYIPNNDRQTWCDFSKDCEDYISGKDLYNDKCIPNLLNKLREK